jgi:hypothetical protein
MNQFLQWPQNLDMPPLPARDFNLTVRPRPTRSPLTVATVAWIQIQVLRRPGSPVKRLPLQQKQHPLHPILLLDKEKDVPLIHHHHQQPTEIIVVSVWRICLWMPAYLHVWHAAEKQFIYIAETIFLEVV